VQALCGSDATLAFGAGLSDPDEPDLRLADYTGRTRLWIEVGQPDQRPLARVCSRADAVRVYALSAAAEVWWRASAGRLARVSGSARRSSRARLRLRQCLPSWTTRRQAMSGRRRRVDADGWRELLRRFDATATTVDEFCAREGLSTSSFYRWRGRLLRSDTGLAVPRGRANAIGVPAAWCCR
jgi:hypothetical protein